MDTQGTHHPAQGAARAQAAQGAARAQAAQGAARAQVDRTASGEVVLGELCDACGQVVDPTEAVKAELTVSGAMCPSPMNFHPECAEKASVLWHPDPDSYCTYDPLYPETGQWKLPEEGGA